MKSMSVSRRTLLTGTVALGTVGYWLPAAARRKRLAVAPLTTLKIF